MTGRDVKDRIKRNLRIEDILYPEGNVKKKGNDIQGAHPHHGSEGGQNLVIHTDTQTWHCFRHDTHGDVYSALAIKEGLVDCGEADDISHCFTEVLEIASDRTGIDLDWDKYDKEGMKKRRSEWEELQEAFDVALDYWQEQLEKRPDVQSWIQEKYGFNDEILEEYEIGFAPPDDDTGLLKRLKDEVGELTTFKTGLVWQMDDGWCDYYQGRVIFPYKYRGNMLYSIGRKTPWTDESHGWQQGNKYIKQLTPKQFDYVCDQIDNCLWGMDTIRGERRVYVTEGISDAISLAHWDYPVISPVTTRFRDDDIKKVKRAVKNKTVYVLNDNDEGGQSGALDTLEHIDNSYLVEWDDDKPDGYDANDYFLEHSISDFGRLLKNNTTEREEALAMYRDDIIYLFRAACKQATVPADAVRKSWDNETQEHTLYGLEHILEDIDDLQRAISIFRRTDSTFWRAPTAVEKGHRKRVISSVIEMDMRKKGSFLYDDDTDTVYYFHEEVHKVFRLAAEGGKSQKITTSPDAKSFLRKNYGINASTREGKFVLEDLISYGATYGKKTDIKKYFYFDEEEDVLYIHNRNDHYYKLDGDSIEKKPNGEELYFITEHDKEIHYLDDEDREFMDEIPGQRGRWKGEGSFLHKILLNRTNFASKTALTERQQRLQWLVTLYMFPFSEWFSTKPIIAFVGQKGSGKSATLRMTGRFLTNPDYELADLPETDKKDFMVSAHNNPFYFLDNADQSREWLNDALASIASGVSMKERQLFTNFGQAEAKISTFLSLNSRTPKYTRDDVVDRLLLFYVDRFDETIREKYLYTPIYDYWDTLWSIYMDDLNEIIGVMKDIDDSKLKSKHRLVDWVIFARMVRRALNISEQKMDELIDDMKYEKDAFSLEDDALLSALRTLEDSAMYDNDRWWSAKQMHDALCELDEVYDESYSSSQSLANRLPNALSELSNLVNLRQRYNKSGNRNEYTMGSPADLHDHEDGEEEEQTDEDQADLDIDGHIMTTELRDTIKNGNHTFEAIAEDLGRDEPAVEDRLLKELDKEQTPIKYDPKDKEWELK